MMPLPTGLGGSAPGRKRGPDEMTRLPLRITLLALAFTLPGWQAAAAQNGGAETFDADVTRQVLDSIEFQFSITSFRDQGWLDEAIRQVSRQRTGILRCVNVREKELASMRETIGPELIERISAKEDRTPEEATIAEQVETLNADVTECKLLLEQSGQLHARLTDLESDLKRARMNRKETSVLYNLVHGFAGIGPYHGRRWQTIADTLKDPLLLERAGVVLGLLAGGVLFGMAVKRRIQMPGADRSAAYTSQAAAGFRFLVLNSAPLLIPVVLLLGYMWAARGVEWLGSAYGQLLWLLLGYVVALVLIPVLIHRVSLYARAVLEQELPVRALDIRLACIATLLALWVLEVQILGPEETYQTTQLLARNVLASLIIIGLLEFAFFLKRVPGIPRTGNLIRALSIGLLLLSLILEWAGYRGMSRFLWGGLAFTALVLAGYYLLEHLLRDFYNGIDHGEQPWQVRFRRFLSVGENEPVPGLIWLRLLSVVLLWTVLIVLFLKIWGASDSTMDSLFSMARDGFWFGETQIVPANVLIGILVFTALLMLFRWVRDNLNQKYLSDSRMDSGAREALVTIISYVGFTIAALAGLSVVGVSFTNIAIVAGALSLGIGFGLQNIVNNFVSGIILLLERPIRTGDWISTGSTEGFVKKISVRSTEVQTFNRADVIVPNSELISAPVTNWTLRNRHGRVIVPVGVAYGSDTELVGRLLEEAAAEVPEVVRDQPDLPVRVFFRSFGDSALDFELRCYILDIWYILDVTSRLHFAIDRKFREHGIEIAFPQRDIHIRSGSPPPGGTDDT